MPTVLGIVVLLFAFGVFASHLVGFRMFAITTGSMTGTVDPGSLVIGRLEPTAALRVGDVLTYLPPPDAGVEGPVTHRLVEIGVAEDGATTYRTKGDANQSVDPWSFRLTDETQLVMQTSVPGLGLPVLWLADPIHRRLVVGGPALLIAALSVVDITRIVRQPDVHQAAAPAVPAHAHQGGRIIETLPVTETRRRPVRVVRMAGTSRSSAVTPACCLHHIDTPSTATTSSDR